MARTLLRAEAQKSAARCVNLFSTTADLAHMPAVSIGFALTGWIVYGPVLQKLLHDWLTIPDYAHGLVIAPLAAWLIWRRRDVLRARPPVPSAAGLPVVVLAAVLLVVGTLGVELFLTRVSLLLFAAGSVVFLGGWRRLRQLLFPFVLLALTIPPPAIVLSRAALSLQLVASSLSASLLDLVGAPVLRDGNVLVLPGATLQVAEACSGLRSLAALTTLALFAARSGARRWPARVAIVAAAVPVAVAVNAVRVAATALTTWRFGADAAQGAIHEAMGVAMFALALACLMIASRAVARIAARLEASA